MTFYRVISQANTEAATARATESGKRKMSLAPRDQFYKSKFYHPRGLASGSPRPPQGKLVYQPATPAGPGGHHPKKSRQQSAAGNTAQCNIENYSKMLKNSQHYSGRFPKN